MMTEIKLLEERKKEALERAELKYQETKDNERYKWAVDTINKKFECEKQEIESKTNQKP